VHDALRAPDLQRDPERFRSSAFAADDLVVLRGGGRTGEPVAVGHDLGAVIANAAHGERDRSVWVGSLVPRTGYREAVIGLTEGADASVQRFLRRGVALPARADAERALGPGAQVRLDDVDRIEPTPGGKVQRIRPYAAGR
jgi:hypothetical protein